MKMRYLTVNQYFSHSSDQDLINFYIKYSTEMIYVEQSTVLANLKLALSEVQFLNSSTRMLYEEKDSEISYTNLNSESILFITINIDPEYTYYYYHISYKPNMIYKETDENIDNGIEFLMKSLFILAQIGGLFSFLNLTLGAFAK